jgi:hypothetical protein
MMGNIEQLSGHCQLFDQWKGRRELVVYDFGTTAEEVPNCPPKIYQSGMWSQFSYEIYQNEHAGTFGTLTLN